LHPPGIVIINKPIGLTSHDVVNFVRKKFAVKRVGHAGTLDPAATGVLVVMIGKKATKLSKKLSGQDKEYIFAVEFGRRTNTGDSDGEVVEAIANAEGAEKYAEALRLRRLNTNDIKKVLPKFLGEIEQTVPLFSAVKIKGKKLYQIARKKMQNDKYQISNGNSKVQRPKRKITIHELELLSFSPGTKNSYPVAKFRVFCSKGTYTRALAEDIGKTLGLPAYQKSLIRTRAGNFTLDKAVNLDGLSERDIIPVAKISNS